MDNTPRQEKPYTRRNKRLIEMYKTGSYNQSALGRIFKISRQQVHELIKRDILKGGEK